MSDTYKVKMEVLTFIKAKDAQEAYNSAVELDMDSWTVLHVEEPELVKRNYPHGSAEGDIYP